MSKKQHSGSLQPAKAVKHPTGSSKPKTGTAVVVNAPAKETKELPATLANYPDLQLQTETMEVHHHPNVEKKNFKEYLLEGLMIFLAVTMGFFAESLRENISEHQRSKEFAASMYIDLKEDTANLARYVKRVKFAANNVDTLMQLLSANNVEDIPSGKLYWYGLFGGLPSIFVPHDATMLEMKSSGSLRFFSKPYVNRMVAGYDQQLQFFKINDEHQQGIYNEVRKTRSLLFNFKYNEAANAVTQQIYVKYRQSLIDSFVKTNPPLLSHDKVLFNQYVEAVRSRFLKNQVAAADTLKSHAIVLIATLKKEFGVENE